MKKIVGMLAMLLFNSVGNAEEVGPRLVLDTVGFQITSKQWVSTQTAILTVTINVTLNNADLVKARSDIMEKLGKIAKGEWHLIQFDRSQDNSGLEKLYVQAQARVAQDVLTNVYQNAKSVSKPGAHYEVGTIDFKPSLEEEQQVRMQLRERLYAQVRDELERINKAYNGQNYSLNSLVFSEGDQVPLPLNREGKINAMIMPASSPSLTVSNELTITAIAQAASNRQQGIK